MLAASGGHYKVVKLLAHIGAALNEVDKNGQTALMLAATNGHADVMRLLVDAGANARAKDRDGNRAEDLALMK